MDGWQFGAAEDEAIDPCCYSILKPLTFQSIKFYCSTILIVII
jgi:hypothetical protein